MDNYNPLFDDEPILLSDLQVGKPVTALQSVGDKAAQAPTALPEGWKITDEPEHTPESIAEAALGEEYNEQIAGFKSPTKPVEPSFSQPPAGVSRAKYAWDKLGDMFSGIAEGAKPITDTISEWKEEGDRKLQENIDADAGLIVKGLSLNPFAPAPQTEVMPEEIAKAADARSLAEVKAGIQEGFDMGKPSTFADMYIGKLGKRLQGLVANDWNRASTHIAETYLKPPKFDDMADAQNYYVNNILDDVTAGIVKTMESVDGIVNFTVNMPAFFGSAGTSVAQASWKYMQNLNQDEWKLDDGELTNAAQYGMRQFNKLFESTSLKPLTTGGAEAIDIAMLPITEFAESISDYGQENGWSQGKIEASQYAFYMALAASPMIKSAIKSMPKTAAELVGRTKAKFGKVPITPEEVSHYMDNYRKATTLRNQKRFESMMKNADGSVRGTLRNQVEALGIEDLEAYKDGTLGGRFSGVVAEEARKPKTETSPTAGKPNLWAEKPDEAQARGAEAVAAVEATKGSVKNHVDHLINNKGAVAEMLMKKGRHDEAATYFTALDEEIAKARKNKGFKTETTPEQLARLAELRKLKAENAAKKAVQVSELEAETAEIEVPEEVPAKPVVKTRKKANKQQPVEPEVAEAAPEAEPTVELKSTDPFIADKSAEEVFSSVAQRLLDRAKGITSDTIVQNAQKPAKKKTVKKSKVAPEVETVNTALIHEMFRDKEDTLSEAGNYNHPDVADSVSISPVWSMRKLVNDVNRFLHGDKGVDINLVADALNNMHQEVNGYRGAFAKQENFNEFYHEVNKAAEFADLAKWNEIDPKVERPGVTLSSGFDPANIVKSIKDGKVLFHTTKQEFANTIKRGGFSLANYGKSIGTGRTVNAKGVSLSIDAELNKYYETPVDKLPVSARRKASALDPRVTIGVRANINKPFVPSDVTVSLKKWIDKGTIEVGEGDFNGLDSLFADADRYDLLDGLDKYANGKVTDVTWDGSLTPDLAIQTVLGDIGNDLWNPDRLTERLKEAGYDSILYNDELLVFDPARIKVAKELSGHQVDGITLASGFDPSLIKSTLQEGIELSKKLVGAIKPSAARKFVSELGKQRELELSGLDAYLAQAEKDGKKVTKEDLLQGMKQLELEMEVNKTSYINQGRAFPGNGGYENHVYKYGTESTLFNESPGHYYTHGPNQVFTTRVSRDKGAYVLEEFQSGWWQKEGIAASKDISSLISDISTQFARRSQIAPELISRKAQHLDEYRQDIATITDQTRAARYEEIIDALAETSTLADEGVISINELQTNINRLNNYIDRGDVAPANIPFRESWGKNAIGLEMMQAVAEGAKEFRLSTAETVLRGEGIINANQTIEGVLKDPGTSEYRKSTIRAIVDAYDKAGPKYIRQLMSRWGEKAEIERVEPAKQVATTETGLLSNLDEPSYWSTKLPDSLHKKVQEKQVVPTVKLSSGLDPADIVREFTGAAKQMQGWFNHLRQQKDVPKTKRIADLSAKLQSDWIDTKAYAKKMLDQMNTKESYEAFKQLVLSAGAQTAGAMAVKRARKVIYKGTNKLRREMVDNVIFARRIIAIDEARAQEAIRTGVHKPVKHPKLSKERAQELGFPDAVELDSKVAKQYLDQLERRLDPADFADIIRRSEIYFNVMRDQLKMLKDKGVISPQLYGRLVKWDYSKRQDIMDKLDPEVTHMIGREPITVRESGVVRLREGTNEDLLEIDSELLMADIVQAAYNRVFRNDTNLALREIAVKNPDNGLVRIPKTAKSAPPRGWSSVELFIDGKHEKLFLENDFARSWLVRNREVSFEIARRNQVFSGSAILKPMATGVNPEFAFANIFRDMAHIWLTSQVKVGDKWVSPYSKHLPLAIPQMAGDLMKVAHDTFTRRGRWIDAVQDGMGMQFLSHEGRVWRKNENIQSNLDLIQEAVGYLNESSEILSRLMVRERAMKNYAKRVGVDFKEFERLNELLRTEWKDGKMVEKPGAKRIDEATRKLVQEIRNEGSFIGRDYMDFSVHGSKGEYADTLIPYLNPGIQGTRGLFRAARRNPAEFATKMAYLTGTTMTLYFMNRMTDEEGTKRVSKEARKNNFIIMTKTKVKDANGIERNVYYTIPKDPSQRYFSYMIEKFMDKFVYGEEVDWPSVTEAVGSLFPISPENVLGITPTGNAILAFYGIDAWRTMLNKSPVAIWRYGELPEDQQGEAYIAGRGSADTPQWAITLGKQFNMKPVEIQQIMGSYVTHTGNLWTWAGGKAFDEIFTDDADEARQEAFADLMSSYERQNNLPLFRRFIGLTASDTDESLQQDEEIIKEHTLDSWMLERKLNVAAQNYILERGDLADVLALKAEYPDNHKKIDEEVQSLMKIMNPDIVSPSNRSFWQSMRKPGSNAEKAERYLARYRDAKDPNQLELERIILGYNTPDFIKEYARILVDTEE